MASTPLGELTTLNGSGWTRDLGRQVGFIGAAVAVLAAAHPPPPVSALAPQVSGELELVYAIGGEELAAGEISDIAVDASGVAFLLDRMTNEVIVVQPKMGIVHRIGGGGDGPGEFRGPVSIAAARRGVGVLDARQARLTVLDASGDVRGTWRWPVSTAGLPSRLFEAKAGFYGIGRVKRASIPQGEGVSRSPQPWLRYVSLRLSGNGFEILPPVADSAIDPTGFQCKGPGVIVGFDPLFGNGPLRTVTEDGLVATVQEDQLRVTVVALHTGDTLQVLTEPHDRYPVSDDEWLAVTEEFRRQEAAVGPFECDIDAMRPTYRPLVRSITADRQGHLWIETTAEEGYRLIGVALNEGSTASPGSFRLPARDARVPLAVRCDMLFLVSVDALGVQTLQVFRMRSKGSPFEGEDCGL